MLRRYHKMEQKITFMDIELDSENQVVTKVGKEVELTPKEFELLEILSATGILHCSGKESMRNLGNGIFRRVKNLRPSYPEINYYIYVTAASKVEDENLCMISRSDVSDAYALRDREIRYFRLILFICLMIESLLIYVISRYLTRPLEQLNRVAEEITDGSYETRITVKSQDEVGLLAENFNRKADGWSGCRESSLI